MNSTPLSSADLRLECQLNKKVIFSCNILLCLSLVKVKEKNKQPSAAVAGNKSYCSTDEIDGLVLLSDPNQINIHSVFHSIASMLQLCVPSGYSIIKVELRSGHHGALRTALLQTVELGEQQERLSCTLRCTKEIKPAE